MVQWMREKHEVLGLGGLPDEHPGDQAGQLNLLRKFIKACGGDHTREMPPAYSFGSRRRGFPFKAGKIEKIVLSN